MCNSDISAGLRFFPSACFRTKPRFESLRTSVRSFNEVGNHFKRSSCRAEVIGFLCPPFSTLKRDRNGSETLGGSHDRNYLRFAPRKGGADKYIFASIPTGCALTARIMYMKLTTPGNQGEILTMANRHTTYYLKAPVHVHSPPSARKSVCD